ncbi:hypothetical protein [Streptococcus suis]|uniref:hypothetical protein n=1 Tax=Streptococcus suis TaxID=1307 RepID=UPI001ABE92A4|nr:hypothetical protein [Streptococcus suis]
MKFNGNKNRILLSGTSLVRGLQVLVACYLLYRLFQTIVYGQEMDMMSLLMSMWSIWIFDIFLKKAKEKKNGSEKEII